MRSCFRISFICIIIIGSFCFGCDNDKRPTNKTNNITNNNTTNDITNVTETTPEPQYVDNLSTLDTTITITEACYNNQVMYVFSKEVEVATTGDHDRDHRRCNKHNRPDTRTEQKIINIIYHLDTYGQPLKCGVQ